MTMILQINLLKNRLKEKICCISDDLIDYLINNLFNTQKNNVYIEFINKIQEFTIDIIKETIVEVFKELDNNFRNFLERIKYYNINKSNISRTIITIVGEITFQRTYFESKDKSKKFFYIDEIFHLPKYDLYAPIIKALAIDVTFDTNQLKAGQLVGQSITTIKNISNSTRNNYYIPGQSINNWINDWNNPKVIYDLVDNTPNTLYVMYDEKFIGFQDLDNDIMVKCFVIFEGKIKMSLLTERLFLNTPLTLGPK